ncbi:PAS domain-containing sensor histidine kinase [Pedobacter polysacchareus]|uniref:PAS domain-containing sensor histidine kinase n=1 Tax=Pedobacter polysacchareus TaxID=2861973 RepID=UPI001C993C7A|nr:PAS domain-containing sensor histidine kinase [Pedobacter polysacchareus]
MIIEKGLNFEGYFRTASPTLILKPDPPYFTILAANKSYLEVTATCHKDLIGRGIFTAFPENPDDRESRNTKILYESFMAVMKTKKQHILHAQRYDIPIRGTNQYEIRYWVVTNFPVLDDKGEVVYVIHTNVDITNEKHKEHLKNDFIAMVSHELKVPLTALKSYLQLSQRSLLMKKKEDITEKLDKAAVQVNKMTKMINGFLDIAKLEAGQIKIEKSQFDLLALIREVVDEIKVILPDHQIIFIERDGLWLEADRNKIGQVITNFLSNAAKYAPDKREIRLDFKKVPGAVRISVMDSGIGMREEDIPHLFSRFKRIENVHTCKILGFGIGLYICAEIVKSHKGKIWAESEFGKGSTFIFELPLSH